jgi:predicted transcriptional regulator
VTADPKRSGLRLVISLRLVREYPAHRISSDFFRSFSKQYTARPTITILPVIRPRRLGSLLQCVAAHATLRSAIKGKTREGAKMDESLRELGDLEREVMQLVWAGGAVTAEAVREQLSRPLKESTVRTVLRRLEDKGYTKHTVEGRTYVYQAAEPRGRVAAKAVQRVVDWFCNGSIEEVLVGMVDTAMLDQKQLRLLADQIAKAKSKAKGGKK